MTLCYTIKAGDIGPFYYATREVYITFQVSAISKPKYKIVMLKQIYIIGTKITDLIFQEVYLAKKLVNPKKKRQIFFEMNL